MYFTSRGVVVAAAIALHACIVPALAQKVANLDGSASTASPAAAAIADKFRHPVGNGRLTENYNDPDGWYVSKGFGDPFGKACPATSLTPCYHLGENWNFIGRDNGQPVFAVANGEILEFGYAPTAGGRLPGSLGNYVLIKHALRAPGRYVPGYGLVKKVVSLYAHLGDLKGICGNDSVSCRPGQAVSIGALIGHIGKTGLSDSIGGGLHFEMRLNEEKCVNGPRQTTARAGCLEYARARYPVKYGSSGGWTDPTCFIEGLNPPTNDDFAAAATIKIGNPLRGSNLCATRENGEPNHAGKIIDSHELNAGGRSVWWKFTASESAKYVVSTIGSKFDTVLGVYTRGTSAQIKDLAPVVRQNDSENLALCKSAKFCTSKVTFTATAGTTYYIAVDGASTGITAAAGGQIQLTVTETGPNLVVVGNSKTVGPFYEGELSTSQTVHFSVAASQDKVPYSISTPSWLTPSSTFGIATTSPKLVTFTVNAKVKTLPAGLHSATIVFASSTNQGPQTRTVSLNIRQLPTMDMSPTEDLVASGGQGGSFEPSAFSYAIKTSIGTLNYSISGAPSWLTMSSVSGKVTTKPQHVNFIVNENAKSLPPGTHTATIKVATKAASQGAEIQAAAKSSTRKIRLTVTSSLQVSSTGGVNISGNEGGPFTPSSPSFSLNSTGGTINYAISGVPSWLTVSSPTGTATTTPKAVTFTVNDNANTLPAGSYNATVIFTNATNNSGTTSRSVTLTVNDTNSLQVSSASGANISGNEGGPFTPSSSSFSLNSTGGTINYAISGVPSWLTVSSPSGTATATPKPVTFAVNASANTLPPGSYNATVIFTNTTNNKGTTTRPITLTVNALPQPSLQIDSTANIVASGALGGPFSPSSFSYQLNATTGTLNYSIEGLPSWLSVSSTSGTLSTTPTIITFTVNSTANALAAGSHNATVTFTNSTNGQGSTSLGATLTVNAPTPPSSNFLTDGNGNYLVGANGLKIVGS